MLFVTKATVHDDYIAIENTWLEEVLRFVGP